MEQSNPEDKNNSDTEEQVLQFDLDRDNWDISKNLLRSFMQTLSKPFLRSKTESD